MTVPAATPSILTEILAHKREEVAKRKAAVPLSELEEQIRHGPRLRPFLERLCDHGQIHLIAEVKRASPSKGVLRADFDPVAIAQIYAAEGATAISVLADEKYFQGHLDHLRQIRRRVDLPLLCKDFIVDVYQIYEARAAGADSVLLIADCLDQRALKTLFEAALRLGMIPLVELHDPAHLPRVLDLKPPLIGINNRNLHTFSVDLDHAIRLREKIPPEVVVVAESGIRRRQDIERLAQAGINAVLVGETLMTAPDIGQAVRHLLGFDDNPQPPAAS
ncbi:MAG: indole-3-glycerol phosphate synthase TrpC [Thermoguttaceae bacterium]|nr:indole-3-glycerol phosphate synthase TrpC [Thermoguttaceae bacterium]MDW8079678.1 indole-3-glycerol phosphate synthase TrpC [Thermoguttaceae bacterium]